jgi:hypothetical protein
VTSPALVLAVVLALVLALVFVSDPQAATIIVSAASVAATLLNFMESPLD